MLQDLHSLLSPQRQAHIYASGLTAIMVLGTLTLIMLGLAALWLVMQFALLLLTTLIASCNTLATTFTNSPDLVKLVILCAGLFVAYKGVRKVWRQA